MISRFRRAMLFGIALSLFSETAHPQSPELGPKEKLALLQAYRRVRDGVPPEGGAKVQASARQAISSLYDLRGALDVARGKAEGDCLRFDETASHLAADLQNGISRFSSRPVTGAFAGDADFEANNRLQIGIAAFSELEFLMKSSAEGGYSILDWHTRYACPFANREQLAASFDTNLAVLTDFFHDAFGSPGLTQMNTDQDRLLRLILADDKADNRRFWTIMAVGTAASIVLWEFGPPIAGLTVRLIWGYTPKLLAVPAVLYGMKFTALVAEGLAFNYADQATTRIIEPKKSIVGSWEEHMNSIEQLLDSPVHAPQLELLFLSRVHTLIFSDTAPWLMQFSQVLSEEESRWGSVDGAIAHYQGGIAVGRN